MSVIVTDQITRNEQDRRVTRKYKSMRYEKRQYTRRRDALEAQRLEVVMDARISGAVILLSLIGALIFLIGGTLT